jgi:hypothetical protein
MLNKAILVGFILLIIVVVIQSLSGKSNGLDSQNTNYKVDWSTSSSGVANSKITKNNNTGSNVQVSAWNNGAGSNSSSSDNTDFAANVSSFQLNGSNIPSNIPIPSSNIVYYSGISPDKLSSLNSVGLNNKIPSSFLVQVSAISQRDPSQYLNDTEFRTWSPSACSAASTAAALGAFGFSVKISDVIALMQAKGGISPRFGLSDYTNFASVAQKYGVHAFLDENHDLETHFNSILTQVRTNHPVIVNVQDSTYFPAGHFIVVYHVNDDSTVEVMNPDPGPGHSVLQEWPFDALKLYFSRTMRSVLFTK